jgi:membrane protease YdiL (CAAX protease family)
MAKALPPLMEGLSNRGIPVNRLALNGGFILATTLCFLWPLTQGIRLRPVLETLGLSLGGVKRVVSDILIAPTYYLASLIVLFGVLLVYSAALQQMNIEMSQGTHPIVPILVSSGDQETRRMIFILAVVIAPFVEEIMFRGAFYSWLRSHLPAWGAIIISSVVFAAVHPQGAVGVVPLTVIGCLLAFLREWRGTLLAPMLAHACVNAGTLTMVTLVME